MPWVGAWVCPYTVCTCGWRGYIFGKWGYGRGRVMMLDLTPWLRHQATVECILHPYHVYRKCFSILICHGWVDGCVLTLLHLGRMDVDFWEMGVWLSPSDVGMSWLRHQTPLKCIPHPYHLYRMHFSTFICHGWAHECALTLLRLCMVGVDFRKWGWG